MKAQLKFYAQSAVRFSKKNDITKPAFQQVIVRPLELNQEILAFE